ncbi:hypothetical protein MIMGU_mgv1a019283mg, partial [Erythranthe guttata]
MVVVGSIFNDLKGSNVSIVSSNNLQFGAPPLNNVCQPFFFFFLLKTHTARFRFGFQLRCLQQELIPASSFQIREQWRWLGGGAAARWVVVGGFGKLSFLIIGGDSGVVADHSQQTDTSTDTDDKNQYPGARHERLMGVDSMDNSNRKIGDQKMLRRLAQNREAARKSRMRKKAYIQQLENGRQKLTQLETELKRTRQQ